MTQNKGGRPPVELDAAKKRLIRELLSYGESPARVAELAGVSEKTLRKYCSDDISSAFAEVYAKVAGNLTQKAMGDGKEAVTAAIFWLKTRARWRETGEEKTQPVYAIYSSPIPAGETAEEWVARNKPQEQ